MEQELKNSNLGNKKCPTCQKKYDKAQLFEAMKTEYFNRHPDAGLAWWMLPVEQQPEGFKVEMYDILWDLTHKEE